MEIKWEYRMGFVDEHILSKDKQSNLVIRGFNQPKIGKTWGLTNQDGERKEIHAIKVGTVWGFNQTLLGDIVGYS